MKTKNELIEEKILYETIVIYEKQKVDTKLRISKNHIILERLKGIFIKKYQVIDVIKVNDIKIVNEKIKIINKKEIVELETNEKNYVFICKNNQIAKEMTETVIKLITGSDKLDRAASKVKKIAKGVTKAAKTIGGTVVAVGVAAKCVKDNKEQILNAANTVKDILKH